MINYALIYQYLTDDLDFTSWDKDKRDLAVTYCEQVNAVASMADGRKYEVRPSARGGWFLAPASDQ